MIRLLHTADWHLGKRLDLCERTEEHQIFLDWLIRKIADERVDVLVVAGDIFDSGAPSNAALKQYYDFLRRVKDTCCREVIIVGGNHDSVSTLNAPKDLLKHFQVHVVGGVPDDYTEQVIPVVNSNGVTELIICAVPFLRDKDVRLSVAGETQAEMEKRLKEGICAHYRKLAEHVAPHKARGIPVLATGHLFAQGASTTESEKDIHVGNLAQIGGDQFPQEFDYIALGHLHRPQLVNQINHIRYSGSPVPLSFSESEDTKVVLLLTLDGGGLKSMEEHPVPLPRMLLRMNGTLDEVKTALREMAVPQAILPSWIEVQITTSSCIPNVEAELNEVIANNDRIERLFVKQIKEKALIESHDAGEEALALFDLTPKAVFQKKCQKEFGDQDFSELEQAFDLAMELMDESNRATTIEVVA